MDVTAPSFVQGIVFDTHEGGGLPLRLEGVIPHGYEKSYP